MFNNCVPRVESPPQVGSVVVCRQSIPTTADMRARTRYLANNVSLLARRYAIEAHRPLVAAPQPGSGPLMERRSDRALPAMSRISFRWLRTLPIFAAIMAGSALAIFNYQKSSSSVVSSTLYALRTSPVARDILGDEVYFASRIPWISGELNQLHGRVDISFWVKGTKSRGLMRFKSERKTRAGYVSDVSQMVLCCKLMRFILVCMLTCV